MKKIGVLSIIGILIVLISMILNATLWYYRASGTDIIEFLIEYFLMFFGLILVLIDYFYIQKKNNEKISDKRLYFFGYLFWIAIGAIITGLIIFGNLIPEEHQYNAGYAVAAFGFITFTTMFIPGLCFGLSLFLILIRTRIGEYIETKNKIKLVLFYIIYFIIIGIIPFIILQHRIF